MNEPLPAPTLSTEQRAVLVRALIHSLYVDLVEAGVIPAARDGDRRVAHATASPTSKSQRPP